jgi:hypothetical protein
VVYEETGIYAGMTFFSGNLVGRGSESCGPSFFCTGNVGIVD